MKLYTPTGIKEIREKFGFNFSKSLGQNFLIDKNIIDKIIEGAKIKKDDLVIEIGPGIGVITYEASSFAKKMIAIEIDKKLPKILKYTLAERDNVEVINKDVLDVNLNEVIESNGEKEAIIIGNLPYYITTPIIMHLLENHVKAKAIVIMMQKEVADRLMATPGTKEYGSITAAVNYYCDIEMITKVPKGAFMPEPKVNSVVLKLIPKKENKLKLSDEKLFFNCIKYGFGKRRKTLLNSLSSMPGITKTELSKALEKANIDKNRRAETLSIIEFGILSDILYQEVNHNEK